MAQIRAALERALESIADWLTGFPRRQIGAIVAAALLLMAFQAGSLIYVAQDAAPLVVHVPAPAAGAGGPPPSLAAGTFAIVAFRPTAPAAEIARLLEASGAEVVEGPKAGIWRVRLAAEAKPRAEAEALLARLKGDGSLVAFAALAL